VAGVNRSNMNSPTTSSSHDYHVEMLFDPAGSLPRAELLPYLENTVIPTLAACERLQSAGRIVAGGPLLGAIGFSFVARVGSATELETMLASLPLWSRARTRVVPLGSFASRHATARARLAVLKAAA